ITNELKEGKNTFAIKVTNRNGTTAGLAARIQADAGDGKARVYLTNPTWRTSVNALPLWNRPRYRDSRWHAAKNLGPYGTTAPWITSPQLDSEPLAQATPVESSAATSSDDSTRRSREPFANRRGDATANQTADAPLELGGPDGVGTSDERLPVISLNNLSASALAAAAKGNRQPTIPEKEHPSFSVAPGFHIEHVVGGTESGSLIAMAFNEFGQILASSEGGSLLLVHDTNDNGTPDAVRVCCDKVFNCQGIVAVSGRVFVVGEGPQGLALYRLEDGDRDGTYEKVVALVRFDGKAGEHGPHGITLGPDGWLYISLGNHTQYKTPLAINSPYRNYYEGDILPRYEDPRGHAKGIVAPGGCIIRVDQDGLSPQRIAGGLRNAYDLAFNRDGELFTHDSDMETDEGTTWHRSTRLLHVVPGGEYGWRSGWAKWFEYWPDTLPSVMDTGRGSPTGVVFYEHDAFPDAYHDALFSCDWAQGTINALRLERRGASFVAQREVFLQGKPLNVTDIEVGPDGWLYFCTGGRGTVGNIYRVVWTEGKADATAEDGSPTDTISSVADAIAQRQMHSAWARQRVSVARQELGDQWDRELDRFVLDSRQSGQDRSRALELMHLVGPPPTDEQLLALSSDEDPVVRARAAYYLGLIENQRTTARLIVLLSDDDATTRRIACDALARRASQVTWDKVVGVLGSKDRFEGLAARRLLEWSDSDDWHEHVLQTDDLRVFVQGALAMLATHPEARVARPIVARVGVHARGFVSDSDFVDLLRVVQVAIERGNMSPEELVDARRWLELEYPAGSKYINRDLTTLLAFLQSAEAVPRMVASLDSDADDMEKLHVATRLRFLAEQCTPEQHARMFAYYEQAKTLEGGSGLSGYVQNVMSDFVKSLSPEDHRAILATGDEHPSAALATLFALPEKVDIETVHDLAALYGRLENKTGHAYDELRIGIIAVMGSSGLPQAMEYLRGIYDIDSERRQSVAMALAQQPGGRNWDYLVRSIPLLEGETAREVMAQLRKVDYAPESHEHLRQTIIAGLRLGEDGADVAASLLSHWTQRPTPSPGAGWESVMADWQNWYEQKHPDQPLATEPVASNDDRWSFEDLETFLASEDGTMGSADRGRILFEMAQCANCHRFQDIGKSFGPDLTTLSNRFQRREILESIVYPSQVISDQYASQTVSTTDGQTIVGLLMPGANGQVVIMQSSGIPVTVAENEIEELAPSSVSSMPTGLLNELSLQEIADLFAFLTSGPATELASPPTEETTR
ncbi:MAG: HEAT repeat domain-containing protein, partial [Planctomycetales bacterium]|nr:HEAT repeat domain-containing protein [Planctomycetales bacterium]